VKTDQLHGFRYIFKEKGGIAMWDYDQDLFPDGASFSDFVS